MSATIKELKDDKKKTEEIIVNALDELMRKYGKGVEVRVDCSTYSDVSQTCRPSVDIFIVV